MSASGGGGGGGGVGGALSLMGCVREASPPPQDPVNQGDFSFQPNPQDNQPKEPKKRRFHPLRGLRKIFRRKSRGAADLNSITYNAEGNDHHIVSHDREEVTLRNPAGRPEESRSRSASDLLTDTCDRDSNAEIDRRRLHIAAVVSLNPYEENEPVFHRRSGINEALAKLRGGPGQLSISHDSVFPGEVPHTRPLSSLDPLVTLERRASKIGENDSKETSSLTTQRHRVSLQVLEQMKTVIESRNQVSAIESSSTVTHNFSSSKIVCRVKEGRAKTTTSTTKTSADYVDRIRTQPREDLPELESNRLNHEAAKHRITVRPKNRRPPNRITSQIGTSAKIPTIFESSDALDGPETSGEGLESRTGEDSPIEPKNVTVIRKSSSRRLIRPSEILGELEAKLQHQSTSPSSGSSSKSPDSLETSLPSNNKTLSNSIEAEKNDRLDQHIGFEIKPVGRKLSNRISKGTDIFAELSSKLPRRRSSVNRLSKSPDSLDDAWSKSTDSFDRLDENTNDESRDALPRYKQLSIVSKSMDRVSKSTDSLETFETLNAVNSDDSIERRRSSFEFRAVLQRTSRAISKSSESFAVGNGEEKSSGNEDTSVVGVPASDDNVRAKKLGSTSDVTKIFHDVNATTITSSKSSESVDKDIATTEMATVVGIDEKSEPKRNWRNRSKRTAVSSESSDNLELDDELENRRSRKPPKRIPSTSIVDITPLSLDNDNAERKPPLGRKLCRFQKSSESSELGSTDTVDSDKKNKSSASVETIDSLERDLDQDQVREEETGDEEVEKRPKNESWSGELSEPTNIEIDDTKPLISEKSYWRRSSDAKENIDIHQLLAITIVTHMADNGNQRNSVFLQPNKKKLSSSTSPPTSPEKQEDNKIMFNNLLSSKNDEDLQNMLNGNISEVSTDTKSFKEKLIMFEKLGK